MEVAPVRIVLATCRTKPALTPSDSLLAAALERADAAVVAVPWEAIDAAGAVCLRSTWDYHQRWDEFRRWLGGFDGRQGRLWNPLETVAWNADKQYLRDLEAAGIPLPRTRWYEPGERPDGARVLRELNLARAVLKPRISASAVGTYLVGGGHAPSEEEWQPLDASGSLLQEFVPEVGTRGEISLVYLDGGFSHAVRKWPAEGDFRVQERFGGRLERVTPPGAVLDFGDAVLSAVRHPWLYARVDLVEAGRGPVLMELELIEPDLFLTPEAAGRMAAALLARAGRAAA
jgi:glutathione synthase/RimK-type ligase-like ATP-grasp enzyme